MACESNDRHHLMVVRDNGICIVDVRIGGQWVDAAGDVYFRMEEYGKRKATETS